MKSIRRSRREGGTADLRTNQGSAFITKSERHPIGQSDEHGPGSRQGTSRGHPGVGALRGNCSADHRACSVSPSPLTIAACAPPVAASGRSAIFEMCLPRQRRFGADRPTGRRCRSGCGRATAGRIRCQRRNGMQLPQLTRRRSACEGSLAHCVRNLGGAKPASEARCSSTRNYSMCCAWTHVLNA